MFRQKATHLKSLSELGRVGGSTPGPQLEAETQAPRVLSRGLYPRAPHHAPHSCPLPLADFLPREAQLVVTIGNVKGVLDSSILDPEPGPQGPFITYTYYVTYDFVEDEEGEGSELVGVLAEVAEVAEVGAPGPAGACGAGGVPCWPPRPRGARSRTFSLQTPLRAGSTPPKAGVTPAALARCPHMHTAHRGAPRGPHDDSTPSGPHLPSHPEGAAGGHRPGQTRGHRSFHTRRRPLGRKVAFVKDNSVSGAADKTKRPPWSSTRLAPRACPRPRFPSRPVTVFATANLCFLTPSPSHAPSRWAPPNIVPVSMSLFLFL